MPVPSAVISVAISCDDHLVEARAFSTLRILPSTAGSPGTCGRGPVWPSRRRSRPRPGRFRTMPVFSWQSASLPGRLTPSSTPLRRVISRALRAASRARAASTILPVITFASARPLEEKLRPAWRKRLPAPPVALRWKPVSSWSATQTWVGHFHRQHAGQALAHVVAGISTFAFLAISFSSMYLLMIRVMAVRRPVRCVPPSDCWGCCW